MKNPDNPSATVSATTLIVTDCHDQNLFRSAGPAVQLVERWTPCDGSIRPGYKSPGFGARRALDVYGPPGMVAVGVRS